MGKWGREADGSGFHSGGKDGAAGLSCGGSLLVGQAALAGVLQLSSRSGAGPRSSHVRPAVPTCFHQPVVCSAPLLDLGLQMGLGARCQRTLWKH